MNTIQPDTSLAELVTRRPHTAATLEALDLDYCCGGAQSLAAACESAGLNVDEVAALLVEKAPTEAPDGWARMDPSELVDHLEQTHHVYLNEALPRLTALLERVTEAHGENHPELGDVGATLAELRRELEPHLLKEERVLFPMIRELYESSEAPSFHCGSLQNPIGAMCLEHDRAGELLASLRTQSSAYSAPSDGCASYTALYAGLAELEADTHLHIHKENNILFPAVVAEELRRTVS